MWNSESRSIKDITEMIIIELSVHIILLPYRILRFIRTISFNLIKVYYPSQVNLSNSPNVGVRPKKEIRVHVDVQSKRTRDGCRGDGTRF